MKEKLRMETDFFNECNSSHFSAAIGTQINLAAHSKWSTFSAGFFNTFIREGSNSFNVHLQATGDICFDSLISKRPLSAGRQADLNAYARRADVSILSIRGHLANDMLNAEILGRDVPETFLGALLAALRARYREFGGKPTSGMTILLSGDLFGFACRLEALLLEVAHLNKVPPGLMDWIEEANYFLNAHAETGFETQCYR